MLPHDTFRSRTPFPTSPTTRGFKSIRLSPTEYGSSVEQRGRTTDRFHSVARFPQRASESSRRAYTQKHTPAAARAHSWK